MCKKRAIRTVRFINRETGTNSFFFVSIYMLMLFLFSQGAVSNTYKDIFSNSKNFDLDLRGFEVNQLDRMYELVPEFEEVVYRENRDLFYMYVPEYAYAAISQDLLLARPDSL